MTTTMFRAALLASAMMTAAPAWAQTTPQEAEPPADAPSPDDASLQTVPEAEMKASQADAEIALLRAQLEAMQAQMDEMKRQLVKAAPVWKGAPQHVDAGEGFSFKVRGRLMIDSGTAGAPDNYIANRNLGSWTTRARRARIGVEGGLPGGFGYKVEADFANSTVGFADAVLTYAPTNKPWALTLGNHETLNGMEQVTSSRWSSFIERAQVNDAFINTRRLGLSAGVKTKDGLFRWDAGLFSGHTIDSSLSNDGWIAATRASWSPFAFGGYLHLGASYQHREFQSNDNGVASTAGGAPSTNQVARYRARPFLQLTDARFVDTGSFAASSDDIVGVELYGVFKSLHLGGEAQFMRANAYAPGTIATGRNAFAGGTGVTPEGDPSFWGGHVEIGYFLTGETRGYKNGLWDRTKVLNPANKGGWGAIQLLARYDYLDLNSDTLVNAPTTNFANGTTTLASTASRQARGGTQQGVLLGLTWIPTDYVRILANYIRTDVKGGPLQAVVNPTSTAPINERSFSTDSFAIRAQVDW